MAGDEVFLRRAYLELTGTIPSVAEARDFLDSTSASKREQLIHTLLDDKRFAEHYAGLWARTLAPAGNTRGPLEAWLRAEFRKNTPFDQMARSMLTATGDATTASPAGFYFAVGNSPERVAEAVGRGLLGVRLGCAQCHNHPLAGWTREDFWGLAAFFAGTGNAPGPGGRRVRDQDHPDGQQQGVRGEVPRRAGAEVPGGPLAAGRAGRLARDPAEPLLRRQHRQPRLAGPVRHRAGLDDRRPRHAHAPRSGSRSSTNSPPSSPPTGSTCAGWSRASA